MEVKEKEEYEAKKHDTEKGVGGRSPFYDLPYFSMEQVQYDLMHTAMGVLRTFNQGYAKDGHDLFVDSAERIQVGLLPSLFSLMFAHDPPPSPTPSPIPSPTPSYQSHMPSSLHSLSATLCCDAGRQRRRYNWYRGLGWGIFAGI